ncbi:MAG: phosphatidylserine synthase [Streptosporangiales bacterium]|nr:phosphatidylserine synthase [Streptosporangiales bacterium]
MGDSALNDRTLDGRAVDDLDAADSGRVRLSVADYFTLGNALCGFMAVCRLAAAQLEQFTHGGVVPLNRRDLAAAVVFLLVAAVCDLFDGKVARRYGGSRMGAELDNLADAISFGFAPAFFVITWGVFAGDRDAGLSVIAAVAVLLAVVVRLARFATQPPGQTYFTGLPAPLGAMTVVAIVLLSPPPVAGVPAIIFVAWLMVSRLEYPKPSGNLAAAVLVWIFASVGCLSAWALDLPFGDVLLFSGAGLVLLLVVMVPLYTLLARRGGPEADEL